MSSIKGGPDVEVRHPDDCPPDLSVAPVTPDGVPLITDMNYQGAVAPAAIGPRHRAETGGRGWRRAVAGVLVAAGLLGSLKGDGNDFEPAPATLTAAELAAQLPSPRGADGGLEAETAPERIAAYEANVQAAYEQRIAESALQPVEPGALTRIAYFARDIAIDVPVNTSELTGTPTGQTAANGQPIITIDPPKQDHVAYALTIGAVGWGETWPTAPDLQAEPTTTLVSSDPAKYPEADIWSAEVYSHALLGKSEWAQLAQKELQLGDQVLAFTTEGYFLLSVSEWGFVGKGVEGAASGDNILASSGQANQLKMITCDPEGANGHSTNAIVVVADIIASWQLDQEAPTTLQAQYASLLSAQTPPAAPSQN